LQPGGRHAGWGTHNRLLQLGGGTYLELLAPDPEQPAPAAPRPFGLDAAEVRARIAERPRLLHFVVRTGAIDAALPALGYDPGPVRPMARGALRWRITVRPDGEPAGGGLLPTLIQWDETPGSGHPARSLPEQGIALERLEVDAPAALAGLLRGLEAVDPRIRIAEADAPALRARLAGPAGALLLD
ncbi:MAG TPA: VOC family protein, partial [Quisquiliibacterium sp.]|nr:VOC family protein [Quisquiliibacterium sp.]